LTHSRGRRGTDDFDVAVTLENYAAMLKTAKRDAEAEPLLKRAKEIREKPRK
jgi:hypothetical protein